MNPSADRVEAIRMTQVLDTAEHPARDRADLVRDVIDRSGVPTRVGLNAGADAIAMRMHAWQLGSTYVLRTEGTGMSLRRTATEVRRDAREMVVLAQCLGRRSTYRAHGRVQELGRDDLHLVDLTGTYDFTHVGVEGGSMAVHLSYEDLGLPVDTVRRAVPRLPESPLMPLVRDHFRRLADVLDVGPPGPEAEPLGAATLALTRALVVSVAGGDRAPDVSHQALRLRVRAYLRRHLADPTLTAAGVAAAHHVSLRTLYNAWGSAERPLMDWVMTERLQGARRDLERLAPGEATVAAVGRRWGFTDPAHFNRRFRGAFGTTPGEWRAARLP